MNGWPLIILIAVGFGFALFVLNEVYEVLKREFNREED